MSEGTAEKPTQITALAVGAHPDDIEFLLAGTLLRLKEVGARIHMWNLANGSGGTLVYDYEDIVRIRASEARESSRIARAVYHPALVDDLAIFYEPDMLARVTAVIREIKPNLILTQSPNDYMEDHQNTCRLVVSGTFCRGIPNFSTDPPRNPWLGHTAIYHCMPHGLRDGLRRLQRSGHYVDISPVMDIKREMLSQHRSQKDWLDKSQGIGSYLAEMEDLCLEIGRMSKKFKYAEGWRRHLHLGFSPEDYDPLVDMLGDACWVDPEYEAFVG